MTDENLQSETKGVLERYASDLVMLDLLWQWATNSLGDDEEATYGNLRRRYRLSARQAEEAVDKFKSECASLIRTRDSNVARTVTEALSTDVGRGLTDQISKRTSQLSLGAKCAVALVNEFKARGVSDESLHSVFDERIGLALVRATLGGLPGTSVDTFQEIRDELVECGVLNRVVWVSRKGNRSEQYKPGPLIPPFTLSEVVPSQAVGSMDTYVASLFESHLYEQARVIEEIATGSEGGLPGVVRYWQYDAQGFLPEGVVPHRGIVAFADRHTEYGRETVAAVNPLVREALLARLVEVKGPRMTDAADVLQRALRTLRDELWPQGELATLEDQQDRRAWRLEQVGKPMLFVYLGNWLSQRDLESLRGFGAGPYRDSFLFVLKDQSLPSLRTVVGNSLKMWQKPPISVIVMRDTDVVSHQLQGEPHPSVSRILELLGGKGPSLSAELTVAPAAILLGSAVTARVQVHDSQNTSVGRAHVVVSWGDGTAASTVDCDDGGTCSVQHVYSSIGTYTVAVSAGKAGFRPGTARQEVEVTAPTRSLQVDLVLSPAEVLVGTKVTATVKVRDDRNNPVAGAEVGLSWGDGTPDSRGPCDGRGEYSLGHAFSGEGTYTVAATASKPGFITGRAKAEITVMWRPPPPPRWDIIIGDEQDTDTGLLGWTADKRSVALDLFVGLREHEERAHAISVFGIPKSGKSYTLGILIEMAVSPQSPFRSGSPLPVVVFHYDDNPRYKPEFAKMVEPTSVADDIKVLKEVGVQPKGIDDLVVLAPPWRVEERRAEFPQAKVGGLTFAPEELGQTQWLLLMGVPGSQALYVEQMKQLLLKLNLAKDLSVDGIRRAVLESSISDSSKKLALQRLELASMWIRQGDGVTAWLKPARLLILDIRDEMIDSNEAMRLCLISLGLLQRAKGLGGGPVPKIVVLDEAHKYVKEEFADEIVTVVNQMRHTATTVVIASQSPDSIPSGVLEKSSVVMLHQLTAPKQVDYLKRAVEGLSRVDNGAIARLKKGHAVVWATTSTDARVINTGLEVTIRPRYSRHV